MSSQPAAKPPGSAGQPDTRTPAEIERNMMNLQENVSDLVALMNPEEFAVLMIMAKDIILEADKRVSAEQGLDNRSKQ